jgi:hypothetical protein
MVVGSGLEEDVCEMEETWSASGEPATSQNQLKTKKGMVPHPVPSRQTGHVGSLYQAVRGMIYPCWTC